MSEGDETITLIGGPLGGLTITINANSTRLVVADPEMDDPCPPVGQYRRATKWTFESFEGHA